MAIKLKSLLTISCCLILANIYYAQPIITDISASIGFSIASAGVIITVIQVGYCFGVLFLVPLVDFVENRMLIALTTLCNGIALLLAGYSSGAVSFFIATLFVGFFSSCVQIIIPFTIGMADVKERGQVAGLVMSGALLGLVLARPFSSFLTSTISWRFVYYLAALFMFILSPIMYKLIPGKFATNRKISYSNIFKSMWHMICSTHRLQLKLFIMLVVFATFTMQWATVPIILQNQLGFSHTEVALFSLVSLVTPVYAIFVGRMVDRGYGIKLTFVAIAMVGIGYSSTLIFGISSPVFIGMVFFVDPGVSAATMLLQQSILINATEARGRANALCIAFTFIGGALGSAIGPWVYSYYGWEFISFTGIALIIVALLIHVALLRSD